MGFVYLLLDSLITSNVFLLLLFCSGEGIQGSDMLGQGYTLQLYPWLSCLTDG